MEVSLHAWLRTVIYDPDDECSRIAWEDGEWRRMPPGGWGKKV